MGAKTISFPKGKGSLNHNNREFICDNVHEERTSWNRTYKRETIKEAYDVCFGQALAEYNARQKRKDRIKENYLQEIKNSGNKEKVFYENVIQIGTKDDTPVVDENGNLTEDAKVAIEVLDEYARTFQERNPNLYVFNSVLHLDEATPHLHIDYIPVANGYKNGLQIRNSLTKAFQEMGFAKAVSKKVTETTAWQEREREHLTQLSAERGIEIKVKGEVRDNYSLPEYKEAMRAVEALEEQKIDLEIKTSVLEQTVDRIQAKTEKEKAELAKYDLKAETLKTVEKEVNADMKKTKSMAVPTKGILDKEEYVKVKKSDWNKILEGMKWAVTNKKVVDKYEKKIIALENKLAKITQVFEQLKKFLSLNGLTEAWNRFIEPKSIKRSIEEHKKAIQEQSSQKKTKTTERKTGMEL
ncbi:plasmid recombination protein [Hespellia stercorisuis]|uniref:Plasmid recombination enzyme n=1 Tax=Hespellia stercorisuis DSM 15480 TaxID=1121950 RepID=A0A1M6VRE4_9FIRM|nr:plasmid recombination protein [Hespellia stercorisuis]SHK84058.1 Plasmid recombination enzyme [Hespellia stercorisuis DSM 15480]